MVAPGDKIIWRHEMRGGYGYVERIPGEVIRVTAKRIIIRIAVHIPHGLAHVERSVRPEHIEVQRQQSQPEAL